MADIFISYSSKDQVQAEQLVELLLSAGLSVWIDKQGIDAATSWSAEIVDGIDGCIALIVLLSANSVASKNVVREVALAFEKDKKILPLDLEPIVLPRELQYHLAGIQRTPLTNIDSVIRVLSKFGLEATQAPTIKIVKETDGRKSLMILPFEDLSPTADNGWFADGIVTELIGALTCIKMLRLTDPQTTKEFKSYKGSLATYAREMSIRYFVQGSIRKIGDQVKIMAHVLDIESGDYLWQDSLKGTMDDIFDIQETVARKVVGGLAVILSPEEEKSFDKKLTENTEAYELYMRGNEYYSRHARSDVESAIAMFTEAVKLDPHFADAHLQIANAALSYYRTYTRDPQIIESARAHTEQAAAVLGESAKINWIRSILSRTEGNFEEAVTYARRATEQDTNYSDAYDALAYSSMLSGNREAALAAREKFVALRPGDRTAQFGYLTAIYKNGDMDRLADVAQKAVPLYERHLRLNPGDLYGSSQYVQVLSMARESERAFEEARKLESTPGLDGYVLYNLASAYVHIGEKHHALTILQKAIEAGFRNIDLFRIHPALDPLRGMPEFEALLQELEGQAGEASSS